VVVVHAQRFRRLTLRSATGRSQRDPHYLVTIESV